MERRARPLRGSRQALDLAPSPSPPRHARGATRNQEWMSGRPRLRTTDGRLAEAYARAIEDLAALRLHDPEEIRRPVLAAGAPWYMALFGRDALIAAYMALPIDRQLALGVLDALAELQGDEVDPTTEKQPGRIVHETRFLGAERINLTGHSAYYGSIDATPLFVMMLGELCRWGSTTAICNVCSRTLIGRSSGWSATATATATVSWSTSDRRTVGW